MKDYKRFTERDEFGNADIIGIGSYMLASELNFDEFKKLTSAINRFAELEDKIERGEIDYVVPIKPDQTISDLLTEFDEMGFAPTTLHPDPDQYAIDWRDQVHKEFARLVTERDDYKSRAEVAEQEAMAWKDCANKWQKYYKEQAEREIEEERK